MMLFKVIILVTICAVDCRMLLSELDQVYPARQLNQHVGFPMVYKYDQSNQHVVLDPIWRYVRSAHRNIFQELQYAPLYEGLRRKIDTENVDEVNKKDVPAPPSTSSSPQSTENTPDEEILQLFRKTHLEPRPDVTDMKWYNSEKKAAASVGRSQGHNVEYKIIPESIPSVLRDEHERKPVKISDYLKPIGINLNLESLTTTIAPLIDLSSKQVNRHLELSKEQVVMNPIEHFIMNPRAIKNNRYLPYTKFHRLHLNIARVYSPGQSPVKRPRLPVAYAKNFDRRNKYSQDFVPQAYKDLSLTFNTMLHPIKQLRNGFHLRETLNL